MKLDEIYAEWKKDSEIDMTALGDESLKIPKLHHKYFQVYSSEKLLLRKYEAELKQLKLAKYEFYTQGPSKESLERGWDMPAKGMILKQEMPMYLEGDKDMNRLKGRIQLQEERVEYIESTVKAIANRGWLIRNAIDWKKFLGGV